jgi:hypothetical protein
MSGRVIAAVDEAGVDEADVDTGAGEADVGVADEVDGEVAGPAGRDRVGTAAQGGGAGERGWEAQLGAAQIGIKAEAAGRSEAFDRAVDLDPFMPLAQLGAEGHSAPSRMVLVDLEGEAATVGKGDALEPRPRLAGATRFAFARATAAEGRDRRLERDPGRADVGVALLALELDDAFEGAGFEGVGLLAALDVDLLGAPGGMERQVDSPERPQVRFDEVFGDDRGSAVEGAALLGIPGDADVDPAASVAAFGDGKDADVVPIRALQPEPSRVAEELFLGGEMRQTQKIGFSLIL